MKMSGFGANHPTQSPQMQEATALVWAELKQKGLEPPPEASVSKYLNLLFSIEPQAQVVTEEGEYHVGEPIGQGTFKIVFGAQNVNGGPPMIMFGSRSSSKAQCEAAGIAAVQALEEHPNIARLSVDLLHQSVIYRFRPVIGFAPRAICDLSRAVDKLEWGSAVKVSAMVTRGLAFLHQHQLLHEDVKPANVLLFWDQDSHQIRAALADFGLVQTVARAKRSYTIRGTQAFMSPDKMQGAQHSGTPDDIWALGLTLFPLLAHGYPNAKDWVKGELYRQRCSGSLKPDETAIYFPPIDHAINLLHSAGLEGVCHALQRIDTTTFFNHFEWDGDNKSVFIKLLRCFKVQPTDRPTALDLLACFERKK